MKFICCGKRFINLEEVRSISIDDTSEVPAFYFCYKNGGTDRVVIDDEKNFIELLRSLL